MQQSVGTPALWAGFMLFVVGMLALDLGVFHRKAREPGVCEALVWTAVWIGLALIFNAGIRIWFGPQPALEFFTAYVIEKALSVDNIFVFLVIFSRFSVPAGFQQGVLLWGVVGALIMRAVFIFAGTALIHKFHWVIYLFGAFLVITGLKLFIERTAEIHPERNPLLRLFRRFVPSLNDYRGRRFVVVEGGRRYATPLLLVLVTIEATDIVFAMDSIPAVLAVTTDAFIVYSSNIFAILGLRSLYFALAAMMEKFRYLKSGLSVILVFVGAKMLLADVLNIPILVSLAIIAVPLIISVAASFLVPAGR